MKQSKKLVLGISSLIVGLCFFTSCGGEKPQQASGTQQVATLTVGIGSTELNSVYPTTIKGKTDIEIRPQVSGFITRVLVDEGQRVRKGQALFEIDRVQYEAAVRMAEASVQNVEYKYN